MFRFRVFSGVVDRFLHNGKESGFDLVILSGNFIAWMGGFDFEHQLGCFFNNIFLAALQENLQGSGQTMVVIGDVAGHDTAAAAAMGQLRGLLRGIAVYSDAGPAEVLRGLDAAMDSLMLRTLATAAVARFEQSDEEHQRGVTRMIWSNAGHPPPILFFRTRRPGQPGDRELSVGGTVVGPLPEVRFRRGFARMHPGEVLVLCTDGILERPDHTGDFYGNDRLRDLVVAHQEVHVLRGSRVAMQADCQTSDQGVGHTELRQPARRVDRVDEHGRGDDFGKCSKAGSHHPAVFMAPA